MRPGVTCPNALDPSKLCIGIFRMVQRRVGWRKGFRRIGARFERLAVNLHGMLQLALIRRYLPLLF